MDRSVAWWVPVVTLFAGWFFGSLATILDDDRLRHNFFVNLRSFFRKHFPKG